jgi:predicted  nucleic acid-binding Zn-ribbon protein
MTSDSPQLRGALFGFKRASVRQLLAGRETMFRFAQERAQAAEAKAEELQAELKAAKSELVAQTEAAESAHAATRAELREATDTLREQTERAAAVATSLSELEVELAEARHTAEQQADAMRKLVSVQTELETARTQLSARTEEARSAEAQARDLQAALQAAQAQLDDGSGEPGLAQMPEAEDLTLMLNAAERGVTGIMERARHAYEAQLEQAERVRETIQADIERFGDWQGNVEPLIRSVQQGIESARGRIIRIPDQIREAVDSMTDAMMAVSESLDRLATVAGPPSLGSLAGSDESLGTTADPVIRLKDDDEPPASSAVVLPPEVSETEHGETYRPSRTGGWAEPADPGEALDEETERTEGDHFDRAQPSGPPVETTYKASMRPREERSR